jgi:hypothetical protein
MSSFDETVIESIFEKFEDLKKGQEKNDLAIEQLRSTVIGSFDGNPGLSAKLREVERDLDALTKLQEKQIEALNKAIELNKAESEKLLRTLSIEHKDTVAAQIEKFKIQFANDQKVKEEEHRLWFKRVVIQTLITVTLSAIVLFFVAMFKNQVINTLSLPPNTQRSELFYSHSLEQSV